MGGVIYADVNDDLEKKFKMEVIKKYGTRRGAITKAVKEAIELWLEKEQTKKA